MTDLYVQPFNGAQYMASFSASSPMTTTDDWMISKELELTKAHRLIFYAKGYLEIWKRGDECGYFQDE